MSNRELDNLFKNKLEDFEKRPAQNLWAQIDEKIEGPRKTPVFWIWSVAASIILLMLAGIIFYSNENIPGQEELANNEMNAVETKTNIAQEIDEKTNQRDKELKSEIEEIPVESYTQKEKPIAANTIPSERKESYLIKESNDQIEVTDAITNAEKVEIISPDLTGIAISSSEKVAKVEDNDATNQPPSTSKKIEKGRTLVFDISQFTKENTLANSNEEETSKFRKILKFAKEVKKGESGLGELRKAKNELFAMNKRKENNGK